MRRDIEGDMAAAAAEIDRPGILPLANQRLQRVEVGAARMHATLQIGLGTRPKLAAHQGFVAFSVGHCLLPLAISIACISSTTYWFEDQFYTGIKSTMIGTQSRQRQRELGDFVRAQRERLKPADVGLPAGPRRRTSGLRREEVAQLCGLSVTWYTWLEQGRDMMLSVAALARLARALRLGRGERALQIGRESWR